MDCLFIVKKNLFSCFTSKKGDLTRGLGRFNDVQLISAAAEKKKEEKNAKHGSILKINIREMHLMFL